MISTVTLSAPAKINLHLEILRQRHDGYHDVETILQAINVFDTVKVTLRELISDGEPKIQLNVVGSDLVPDNEENLCWQAAVHFCKQTKTSGSLLIELTKEIPVAAGLGGGSSDAAAVLIACNRLFKTELDDRELQALGAGLGADVPFFIKGGTAMARGIGTELTQLPGLRACKFLIVKPGMELKTSEVYNKLKMGLTVNSPKANISIIKPFLTRFPSESWPGFNRLEEVVLPSNPALQRLVIRMQELAPVAMLSGSGPTVLAAFGDDIDLSEILGEMRETGYYFKTVDPYAGGAKITYNR